MKETSSTSTTMSRAETVTQSNKKSMQESVPVNFSSEVVNILKDLHSNQNKVNDKLEKLSSQVDSLYDSYSYENDNDYEQYDENVDPDQSFERSDGPQSGCSEPPNKKQKTTEDSVFRKISKKFNPKESVDSEVDEDLASFINSTFRDGYLMRGKVN